VRTAADTGEWEQRKSGADDDRRTTLPSALMIWMATMR